MRRLDPVMVIPDAHHALPLARVPGDAAGRDSPALAFLLPDRSDRLLLI